MTVPNAWPGNLGSTADWGNETTAQADAGTVAYPRGRVLGGSGAINAMAHVRGAVGAENLVHVMRPCGIR